MVMSHPEEKKGHVMNIKTMCEINDTICEKYKHLFTNEPLKVASLQSMLSEVRAALIEHGATTDDLVNFLAHQFKNQRQHITLAPLTGVALETVEADAFGFDLTVSEDGWSYTFVERRRSV
jgi:ornithine cyclodeaminase/alanine dehydrogenase-like protein (mu-crystallin family)